MKKIIKCKICKEMKEHYAKGICRKCYSEKYHEDHREEAKQYHINHQKDHNEQSRQYYVKHREKLNEQSRQYYIDHKDDIVAYKKQYYLDNKDVIAEQKKDYNIKNGILSMSENRLCPAYLGIHIAERMLSHLFKNVIRMPHNNSGFDLICSNGHKIDVKSSCRYSNKCGTDHWMFMINHNIIADFFLFIAFDNRENLNPEHLWLIPGNVMSHLTGTRIAESTLEKWSEYEIPVDSAINCCNTLRDK